MSITYRWDSFTTIIFWEPTIKTSYTTFSWRIRDLTIINLTGFTFKTFSSRTIKCRWSKRIIHKFFIKQAFSLYSIISWFTKKAFGIKILNITTVIFSFVINTLITGLEKTWFAFITYSIRGSCFGATYTCIFTFISS